MMDACLHQSHGESLPIRVKHLDSGTVILKFGAFPTGEVDIFVNSVAEARRILDEALARLDEIEGAINAAS